MMLTTMLSTFRAPLFRLLAPISHSLSYGGVIMAASFHSSAPSSSSINFDQPPLTRPPASLRYDNLRDNEGANTRVRRKGRGVGSGHGLARSAGLGTRGQKSHGGGLAITFEGGQSPLWRRTPKFGQMQKMFREEPAPLNLDRLQLWLDTGRLDAKSPITLKDLLDSGCVSRIKHGVKLLSGGAERFTATGVNIQVSAASAGAIAAIEGSGRGGSVTSIYLTRLALHAHLHPERYDIPIRAPRPPPRKMAYYTNYRTRGYLSSQLQLMRLKTALKEGKPNASFQTPLWVGGAEMDSARHLLDIDTAPWEAPPRVLATTEEAVVKTVPVSSSAPPPPPPPPQTL